MRIGCPYCGERGNEEFSYLGDADALARRPDAAVADAAADAAAAFHDYVYLRDNPAGTHRELWQHWAGCGSWLVVTRDTRSHVVSNVALACERMSHS